MDEENPTLFPVKNRKKFFSLKTWSNCKLKKLLCLKVALRADEKKVNHMDTKVMIQQQEMVQQHPVLTKARPLTEEQARTIYRLLLRMKKEREREELLHSVRPLRFVREIHTLLSPQRDAVDRLEA